jgi:hypothetical protein
MPQTHPARTSAPCPPVPFFLHVNSDAFAANSAENDANSAGNAANSAESPSNSAVPDSNSAELHVTAFESSNSSSVEVDAYSAEFAANSAASQLTRLETDSQLSSSITTRTPTKQVTGLEGGGGWGVGGGGWGADAPAPHSSFVRLALAFGSPWLAVRRPTLPAPAASQSPRSPRASSHRP